MAESNPHQTADNKAADDKAPQGDFFDQLLESPASQQSFTIGFRGYDKTEVDAHLTALKEELRRATDSTSKTDEQRRAEIAKLEAKHRRELEKAKADHSARTEQLESDLATAQAKVAESAAQIQSLSTALAGSQDDIDEAASRSQFETVLRVAEEQASVLIQNAAVQAERLLEAAREEAATKRAELEADVARITAQAERDADQVRLKMDTEFAAHTAQVEREAAHAQEKVNHAEQEAHSIRTEAEKGAAALRAMVTREATDLRVSAERDVREMNARVLEMEESITRRQDDAQQEFLVLHNQAVAHAERITADANEQVAGSLAHAERISAKADDYERLMRSQAGAIEAEAQVRARETLDRARTKAQKIVDMVTSHTANVVRDADDRARQLRWQQQQLTSFMAEVRELIRPDGALGSEGSGSAAAFLEEAEESEAPEAE
ncbi:cell division initiation protein [Microbacterium capsulatum]|uniref:Cell division initiation protein n=1 Tax=Microbacterium capsulatum TaxID=3041921 RepID=A0ABU0XID2_9MICO|nr:cell division initiation protein [Microbacterium sp. ASV81]MDQ4214900.1 cell division initiation protein [Microbacterium sp. ASV81]